MSISVNDQTRLFSRNMVPFPPNQNHKFTFIDLFCGIGGLRLAFQNNRGKCIFSSDINVFARKTYEKNFGEMPHGDITRIPSEEIPHHDILLGGFPCQPFSIAGVSKKISLGRKHGFECADQGNLFFEVARIIRDKKPKMFLLENVKNLKTHDNGKTFNKIREIIEELDYDLFFKIIDGKYHVPQHRERIYMVGFNRNMIFKKPPAEFMFPEYNIISMKLADILEKKVDEKYTLSDTLWNYLLKYAEKHKNNGNGFGFGIADPDGITRTLSARYYKDGSEILISQIGKNPRRLTPRECARLMGFPDSFQIQVSDTQAYRQFGNSVIVPVVTDIAREMAKFI